MNHIITHHIWYVRIPNLFRQYETDSWSPSYEYGEGQSHFAKIRKQNLWIGISLYIYSWYLNNCTCSVLNNGFWGYSIYNNFKVMQVYGHKFLDILEGQDHFHEKGWWLHLIRLRLVNNKYTWKWMYLNSVLFIAQWFLSQAFLNVYWKIYIMSKSRVGSWQSDQS